MTSSNEATLNAIAIAFAACCCSETLASTNPVVRNVNPEIAHIPPGAEQPIYYPIGLDAGGAGGAAGAALSREALLFAFMERHTASDYPAAAEFALRLVAAAPERPEAHYNFACVLSRMHRIEEALDALHAAIEHGWRDVTHTQLDPDLAMVRGAAAFDQLLRDMTARREAERISAGPLRSEPWQRIATELNIATPLLLQRYHVPGASIAMVREGAVVWIGAFGERDARSADAMQPDDQFRVIAPLHVLALLSGVQLQATGRLDLRGLLYGAAHAGAGGPALIRTSGETRSAEDLPRRGVAPARLRGGEGPANLRPPPPRASVARNSDYGRLRSWVEGAARGTFTRYCERLVFPAAGMARTSFAPAVSENKTEQPDGAVLGHSVLGSPMHPSAPSMRADGFEDGGELHTTAEDLARLMLSAMDNQPTGADQLSAAGAIKAAPRFADTTRRGLGFALAVRETPWGARVQVLDESAGIVCLMRWYPDSQSGVVVLCNAADGRACAERLAHLALGGE